MSESRSEGANRFRKDSHGRRSEDIDSNPFESRRSRRLLENEDNYDFSDEEDRKIEPRSSRRDKKSKKDKKNKKFKKSKREKRSKDRSRSRRKKSKRNRREPIEENKVDIDESVDTSRIDPINATDRSILETDHNLNEVDSLSSYEYEDEEEEEESEEETDYNLSDRDKIDSAERSDIFPEKEKEDKEDERPDEVDRIDVGNFIVNQARKKAKKLELDRMTENLILLSNALRNLFLDDAQDIIRNEKTSFKRDNFNEAVLFLFLTVYYKQETSYDTIIRIMQDHFRNHKELERFTDGDFYYHHLSNSYSEERKEFDKYILLKASVLSCTFIINLIVEKADLTNI